MNKARCDWAGNDPRMIHYHDNEWGVPKHDDQFLFELLCLESAQAGLSWQTILNKRAEYKRAFDDFDVQKVAHYDDKKFIELMQNAGIVRNKLKIRAFTRNANSFIKIQQECGSFDAFLWQFTCNEILSKKPNEAITAANNLSKELKRRHFTFVGPTICYAYMQSAGLINDHEPQCFRNQ